MRVAVLMDGGHVRVLARQAGKTYDPAFIEKVAHACVAPTETLLRVLYYDCAPFTGTARQPVSGLIQEFKGSDRWLYELAEKDLFAIRLGVLKFRGYKPRKIPVAGSTLTDADFSPDFEQKGVDMRIGLDMANFSATKSVDRLILVTGDTDCLPAMKHARTNGLQVVLVTLAKHRSAAELRWHSDLTRRVDWPVA